MIEKIKGSLSDQYPYYIPTGVGSANNVSDRVFKNWTVAQIYAAWDEFITKYPKYVTKETAPYKDMSDTYDLLRYVFTPEEGYEKTILIQAGVHGTEKGSIYSTLRIFQILCEKWRENPQLGYLRNYVRFVVIPLGNPWGYANGVLVNADTLGNTGNKGTNINRNFDANWLQVMSTGSDYSGSAPFSSNEAKWVRDTALEIGIKNIHYAIDMHDAGSTQTHGDYWINYNTYNSKQRSMVRKLINYLVDKNLPGQEANIYHVADTGTSGVFASYFNKTLGVPASTVEVCFDEDTYDEMFMTKQVETRINAIIMAAITDFKSPEIIENKAWFKLDYWESVSEKEFRPLSGYKSFANISALWDALCTNYPLYASKSDVYVTSSEGYNVYTYTLSPLKYSKTILIVGGRTYAGKDHDRFSQCMYKLAKLLCMHGNSNDHLAYIKNNVRLVFIPYIEYSSSGTAINASGNFAPDGTPNLSVAVVSNLHNIVTGLSSLDGVIYSRELSTTGDEIINAATNSVFTLSMHDTGDSLGVHDYTNWLIDQGENAVVENSAQNSEFSNYIYNNQNKPCVRIDTGIDHINFNLRKTDFAIAGSSTTITADAHLNYAHETARRITNIVNIIKVMCR
jgi:succinylglutamate desuccinylase